MNDQELTELARKFDYEWEIDKIPDEIAEAMQYIDENTGLLGDYNPGKVRLVDDGKKIQWYARSQTGFSHHDDLLQHIQLEMDDVMLGVVGTRHHVNDEGPWPYAEIHPTYLWDREEYEAQMEDG